MSEENPEIPYRQLDESLLTSGEQALVGYALMGYDLSDLPEGLDLDREGFDERSLLVAKAMSTRIALDQARKAEDIKALEDLVPKAEAAAALLSSKEKARVTAEMARTSLLRKMQPDN